MNRRDFLAAAAGVALIPNVKAAEPDDRTEWQDGVVVLDPETFKVWKIVGKAPVRVRPGRPTVLDIYDNRVYQVYNHEQVSDVVTENGHVRLEYRGFQAGEFCNGRITPHQDLYTLAELEESVRRGRLVRLG